MSATSRPCEGCGAEVPRTGKRGAIRRYCSDNCKPRCTVPGCEQPQRKRTWCASHYAQHRHTGQAPQPFAYKWAEPQSCKVCGTAPGYGFREFCGQTCWALWKAYGGQVPTETRCVGCGCALDLTVKGKGGQRRKASVKFCRRCKGEYGKYELTSAQLAERDGTDCGICGEPVNMNLRRFEEDGLMCASVDHILPRSLGGGHEPENLQLAHLVCNMRKSDRVLATTEGGAA